MGCVFGVVVAERSAAGVVAAAGVRGSFSSEMRGCLSL